MADDPDDPYGSVGKGGNVEYQPAAPPPRVNYPDMTPGVTPPPPPPEPPGSDPYSGVLGKSWDRLPSNANPAPPVDPSVQRIREAVLSAYNDAPSLGNEPGNRSVLTRQAQDWLNKNFGSVGGWIANEPGMLAGTAVSLGAAIPTAVTSTLSELASRFGAPGPLVRDLNIAAASLPAHFIASGGPSITASTGPPSTRLPEAEKPIVPPSIPGPPVPGQRGPSVIQPLGPEAIQSTFNRATAPGLLNIKPDDGVTIPAPPGAPQFKALGPTSPTGIAPPMAPPEGAPPPPKPTTSAGGFATSDQLYKLADAKAAAAGDLPPSVSNGYLNSIKTQLPSGPWATATGGTDAITDLYNRAVKAQGQPMSGADALQTDQQLTTLIHDNTDPVKGPNDIARRAGIIQDQFRAATDTPEHVQARAAWQQAEKMKTLEDINDYAQGTQNPTAAIKTRVNALLNNDKASAGWTDTEKAAAQNWADRGELGGAMYALGSRITPRIVQGVATGSGLLAGALTGDWPTSLAAGITASGVSEGGSALARAMGDALSRNRLQLAQETLSKSMPNAPPRPASPFVATTPGTPAVPTGVAPPINPRDLAAALTRLRLMQAAGQPQQPNG